MKKTKIICTMGPNTDNRQIMYDLVKNGMDVARFNFSHGDYEEQKARMDLLKEVRRELKRPVAILLDTKGPEIRTGLLEGGEKVTLQAGETFTLTSREIVGNDKICSQTYERLSSDVKPGNFVLIDDGLIALEVQETTDTDVICRVVNGGELGQKKGINVPNVDVKLPAITEKDKEDILFGISQGIDYIAASFVRTGEAVREIKELLKANGGEKISVIAKVENAEGLKNIDEIIRESAGVMVARGDLGVEIPPQEVPHVQKTIIQKCNSQYKPVITATQMLDSMIRNPRPTRAEVTDVANAIYDGSDAVMLSGETAMGKYPVEALQMMVQIAKSSEEYLDALYYQKCENKEHHKDISHAVSLSSVSTATMLGAKAIIAPTMGGLTATSLSKWRPHARIIGMSPNKVVVRQMQLLWGVTPILASRASSTDELVDASVELAKKRGLVQEGDTVVLAVGVPRKGQPAGVLGETNTIRVVKVD